MANIEYYFDSFKVKNINNFEKELREKLEELYAVDNWILSTLLPAGDGVTYIIICHHLKDG
jgi:hypothetical protein